MDRTFCVFGDSVTQAAYVKIGWVELFRVHLEEKYPDNFINVFNLGIGGNTSEDILRRFDVETQVRLPTDVIFSVGLNDSGYFRTPDRPIVSEANFTQNIRKLVSKSKTLTNRVTIIGPVIGDDSVLKPFPGSSKGKSYEQTRVAKYSLILKEIAQQEDCQFIELLDKLKPDDFQDGLHPNESGHQKMFNEIKKYFN